MHKGYQEDSGEISDELLAIRCQLGEADAFDELVHRWHAPLWGFLRRLSGDADIAADALQETWLAILRGIPRLREPARLRPWLFGIARRVAMNRLRSQYRDAVDESVDVTTLTADVEMEAAETLEVMHEQLQRLPLLEREVLGLFYLQELSLAQIADVLTVPVGTVKSRLFRARRMLRQLLIHQGIPT